MADNTLLKLGIFGAAGYLAYKQGWLSFLGIGGATTPTPTAGSGTGTPAPGKNVAATPQTPAPPSGTPALPSGLTLDTLGAALLRAAIAAGGPTPGAQTPDSWNFFLMQVYPGFTAPDPLSVFPGVDRTKLMDFTTYWSAMHSWLATNKGLSGMSGYLGLAGLARRQGWGAN